MGWTIATRLDLDASGGVRTHALMRAGDNTRGTVAVRLGLKSPSLDQLGH